MNIGFEKSLAERIFTADTIKVKNTSTSNGKSCRTQHEGKTRYPLKIIAFKMAMCSQVLLRPATRVVSITLPLGALMIVAALGRLTGLIPRKVSRE